MSTFENLEKLGRQAWLTGLGAYGVGVKYATETLDETYTKTNKLVNELMAEGEQIEKDLREKLKAKEHLDEKIVSLKTKLGLNAPSKSQKLDELTATVDQLTDTVAKLIAAKQKKPAAKKAATSSKATKTKAAS